MGCQVTTVPSTGAFVNRISGCHQQYVGSCFGIESICIYLTLGILDQRTSDDERLGCTITETKRKVFRFHYHSKKVSQDP